MANAQAASIEEMGQAEKKAWAELVVQLERKGVKPSDAKKVMLKEAAKRGLRQEEDGEEQDSIFTSRGFGRAVNSAVTWKQVLMIGIGTLLFLGVLKLIGMAFDVSIPYLHTASA